MNCYCPIENKTIYLTTSGHIEVLKSYNPDTNDHDRFIRDSISTEIVQRGGAQSHIQTPHSSSTALFSNKHDFIKAMALNPGEEPVEVYIAKNGRNMVKLTVPPHSKFIFQPTDILGPGEYRIVLNCIGARPCRATGIIGPKEGEV